MKTIMFQYKSLNIPISKVNISQQRMKTINSIDHLKGTFGCPMLNEPL